MMITSLPPPPLFSLSLSLANSAALGTGSEALLPSKRSVSLQVLTLAPGCHFPSNFLTDTVSLVPSITTNELKVVSASTPA